MTQLIYLKPKQLQLHPENIRLYYPEADVDEMAASIKAHGGVIQALLVTVAPDQEHYHVVDGNLRLAAARTLGDDCPPLKCEVIAASNAEQLLIMATTSERMYPKDPISKGRHYKRLIDQEGMSREEIAERMGCSISTIHNYLRYLEMDEDIQRLIIERKLRVEPRALQLLMRIPDPERRIDLARRFARNGTTSKGIKQSVNHVLHQLRNVEEADVQPIVPRPVNGNGHNGNGDLPREKIWEVAKNTLCEGCRLDGLKQTCYTCPGPYEFVQHMVELAEAGKVKA